MLEQDTDFPKQVAEKPLTHLEGVKGPLAGDERVFEEDFFAPGERRGLYVTPGLRQNT